MIGVSDHHIEQCPNLPFYRSTKISVEMVERAKASSAGSKTVKGLLAEARTFQQHIWTNKNNLGSRLRNQPTVIQYSTSYVGVE